MVDMPKYNHIAYLKKCHTYFKSTKVCCDMYLKYHRKNAVVLLVKMALPKQIIAALLATGNNPREN
jgi:hypothetical protein